MKKSRYQIKYLDLIIVAAICVLGIIFGSVFDLKIAQKVYNPDSGYGAFFETFGESIAYARIPLGGTLIFKGAYKNKTLWKKIVGYAVFVLSLLACIYFLADSFTFAHNDYGRRRETVPSYLMVARITLAFTSLFFAILSEDNSSYLIQIGAIMLVARLGQFVVRKGLKILNARPRYRFIVDPLLNTDGIAFRSWWQFRFQGFSIPDSFKSWPSGHTATAAQLLLLPLIHPALKWQRKKGRDVLFFVSLAIALIIAFSRRVYGAHFLSDVSFGLFVGAFCAYLVCQVRFLLFGKKKAIEEQKA